MNAKTRPPVSDGNDSLLYMMWRLNQACNFDCAYCFREGVDTERRREHPECGRYSPSEIASFFDSTGRTWRIHMTGGEPFLYPKFVELARALSQRHQLTINTNLFTPNVRDFADSVPADRIHGIYATAHIEELDKRPGGMERFAQNCICLQDRGFAVRLKYIAWPPFLSRMETDIAYFQSKGIERIETKIFRGRYAGRSYPKHYTRRERKRLKSGNLSHYEQAILSEKPDFQGRVCMAGHRAFNMDIGGNLSRCCTISESYGNLFEQDYRLDGPPTPCPVNNCTCPYQGLKFSSHSS
jgi:pyruvate-formate lyase-activating enzyme